MLGNEQRTVMVVVGGPPSPPFARGLLRFIIRLRTPRITHSRFYHHYRFPILLHHAYLSIASLPYLNFHSVAFFTPSVRFIIQPAFIRKYPNPFAIRKRNDREGQWRGARTNSINFIVE